MTVLYLDSRLIDSHNLSHTHAAKQCILKIQNTGSLINICTHFERKRYNNNTHNNMACDDCVSLCMFQNVYVQVFMCILAFNYFTLETCVHAFAEHPIMHVKHACFLYHACAHRYVCVHTRLHDL